MHVAARNNAEWCDLVCRSHGLPTRWHGSAWVCLRRSPRFYPDAVTLTADATAVEVLNGIDRSAGCSIKDSFARLDLAPFGFRVLFEARWIRRPPHTVHMGPSWRAVRTAAELKLWAAAHGGAEVFHPNLLSDGTVTVLGAYDGELVVGGVIANRTGAVVGMSNVFGDLPEAADAVSALHPGLPVVGYESGAERDTVIGAGFEDCGPLRVWLHD